MSHKYSVILCTLVSDGVDVWKTPREVLEPLAEMGYDGVDVDAEPDKIPAEKFEEVRELATSLGLKIPALICAWGAWHAGEERNLAHSDEAVRGHAVKYTKKCIDLAATFDDPPMLEIDAAALKMEYPVCSTPRAELRRNFVKSAIEICDYAQPKNVPIAIEPINRFEGICGFLNSITEARSIADEVGRGLGVMADFFHTNIEDGPVTEMLRVCGDKLKHVHLADSNRQAPGTGHIDFADVVRTLNAINYKGYLAVDSVPVKPDWKTLCRSSITYMKQMEETVAFQERLDDDYRKPSEV